MFANVPAGTCTLETESAYFHKTLTEGVEVSEDEVRSVTIELKGHTGEELEQAVMDERMRYDPSGDGKIGLEEAIHALRIAAGIEP